MQHLRLPAAKTSKCKFFLLIETKGVFYLFHNKVSEVSKKLSFVKILSLLGETIMAHSHDHSEDQGMSFEEKMKKLLHHWTHHNQDHAKTYTDWAEKASAKGLDEVAELLKEAAGMNIKMNDIFNKAAELIEHE